MTQVLNRLATCFIGLNVCFLIWGVIQERILTRPYDGPSYLSSYLLVRANTREDASHAPACGRIVDPIACVGGAPPGTGVALVRGGATEGAARAAGVRGGATQHSSRPRGVGCGVMSTVWGFGGLDGARRWCVGATTAGGGGACSLFLFSHSLSLSLCLCLTFFFSFLSLSLQASTSRTRTGSSSSTGWAAWLSLAASFCSSR